jgi:hypothetical protein
MTEFLLIPLPIFCRYSCVVRKVDLRDFSANHSTQQGTHYSHPWCNMTQHAESQQHIRAEGACHTRGINGEIKHWEKEP